MNVGDNTAAYALASFLGTLSDQAGGWIIWQDPDGETFIPFAAWLKKYEERKTLK